MAPGSKPLGPIAFGIQLAQGGNRRWLICHGAEIELRQAAMEHEPELDNSRSLAAIVAVAKAAGNQTPAQPSSAAAQREIRR